jgi:hypothetical protein
MDVTSVLLLALKLAGLVVGGVAAVMQLRSSRAQPLTRYQKTLVLTMIGGLLFAGFAEVVGTTQQVKNSRESDAREARLLAEVSRLTRPLFPIGISMTWSVRADGDEFEPYARSWAKLVEGADKPETWPLSEADLPPKGSSTRQILEQFADLEIRVYGVDRTSRHAFEQGDVLIYTGDSSLHDYDSGAAARQEAFLAKRTYYYRRGGSVDFVDIPTRVARGSFNSGVVAFEDDLLGSTVEIRIMGAPGGANAPAFRELTIHLSGQRNLYIGRSEFRPARSDYGDSVYRATITAAHIARAAVMEP